VFFFFQAEDGIRDFHVTGVQTCALPIFDTSTAIADAAFAPATTSGSAARPRSSAAAAARPSVDVERGMASWYGPGFAGRLTANEIGRASVGEECRTRWSQAQLEDYNGEE